MPPRRKKTESSAAAARVPRRSTRGTKKSNAASASSAIPDVYQEMLAEATLDPENHFMPSPRPVKRRRISTDHDNTGDDLFESPPATIRDSSTILGSLGIPARSQEIVLDDFEGSDDSDAEFEDVDLDINIDDASTSDDNIEEKIPIQIDLSKPTPQTPKRAVQRGKPLSKAERSMRLDVHKWHFLSLVGHGLYRNAWCNAEEIHAILKPMVPRKIVKLLHNDESKPQYEQNYSFNKGVEEICSLWRQQWKISNPGLQRAHWRVDVDVISAVDESDDLDFDDFRTAAQTCRGSRDVGAQLFTALLRSIAVEARLVFSLQVLPFAGTVKSGTPSKSRSTPEYIRAPPQDYSVAATSTSPFEPPSSRPKKLKKIVDSPYPIFWTEILTPNKTWTPVDPIVRNTISKPKTQFEPPLSDSLNNMTYVVAYEEDNAIRDVTRRYTQWFNAKTRKLRIESTKSGEEWYASAMNVLSKTLRELRDDIEDEELAKRANSEGMPHNIQDFKKHPIYVLERHMRANEVLQPRREVGMVNVGTAKNGKIELVFRRQDVHLCRTSDAWYRRGRDVKMGEQPLKQVISKSRRAARGPSAEPMDDDDEDEDEGVGLYAMYQTDMYEPPPVVQGRIPKNAYGNLDVYVPSMIPPGAVHLSHPLAALASKIIGIDFADAVTGFEFKGRQGTAVVNGVVVAEQYTAAVATVIKGLEQQGSEEAQEARSKILLGMWKRMLQALRVRERVESEYGPTRKSSQRHRPEFEPDSDDDENDSTYEQGDGEEGGGFMMEDDPTSEKTEEQVVNLQLLKERMPTLLPEEVVSVPIKITRSPHKPPTQTNKERLDHLTMTDANSDLFDDHYHDHDRTARSPPLSTGGFIPTDPNEDVDMAGGFITDTDNDQGGFLPEETTRTTTATVMGRTPYRPSAANTTTTTTANDTLDTPIHSDVEEDTAFQLAIAESLVNTTSDPVPAVSRGEMQKEKEEEESSTASASASTSAVAVALDSLGSSSPTSLMSHDPNEDDEEPEWLNEALE